MKTVNLFIKKECERIIAELVYVSPVNQEKHTKFLMESDDDVNDYPFKRAKAAVIAGAKALNQPCRLIIHVPEDLKIRNFGRSKEWRQIRQDHHVEFAV